MRSGWRPVTNQVSPASSTSAVALSVRRSAVSPYSSPTTLAVRFNLRGAGVARSLSYLAGLSETSYGWKTNSRCENCLYAWLLNLACCCLDWLHAWEQVMAAAMLWGVWTPPVLALQVRHTDNMVSDYNQKTSSNRPLTWQQEEWHFLLMRISKCLPTHPWQ